MAKKEKDPREYQGVRDEIRQQQMKTKDMSIKGKLGYFWDYYKIHTVAGLFVLFLVVSLIHDITTAKDYSFYGVMLNAGSMPSQELETAFAEYAGLDENKFDCFIDTNSVMSMHNTSQYDMATSQKLMALTQTKDLDIAVFDSEVYNNYAYNEMFTDLRTIFTEQELAPYKEHLYYIDYAYIREGEGNMDYENPALLYYDNFTIPSPEEIAAEADRHRRPEEMEEPVPVGIFIENSPLILQSNAYGGLIPVFGFSSTSQRIDTGKKYLEFIFNESIDFASLLQEPE